MPKVLLVENNALNQKILERRLHHSGYEVIVATNGDQGVSVAIAQQPDLIIMATDLPVMDGWQAIRILKASVNTGSIPVIALTASTAADSLKTALSVGCDDYDTKPVVLKRLLGKIDALLGQALAPPALSPQSAAGPTTLETADSEAAVASGGLNGRYQVVQTISDGTFGQCLLAQDVLTAKPVIINTFKLPVNNPTLLNLVRQSLDSEMRFLNVISRQDDIATCLDHFEQEDVFYWVQPQVVGTSLANELGSAQSMGHVLQLTHSLLSSVNAFHQSQIVHCECHPHSFIRRQSDGRIILVEYGVLQRIFVKLRSHSLPYRQAMLSQRHYQSAEQRVGNPQLNSDIYAIGMILLQSLTGQPPDWLISASSHQNLTDLVKADPNIVKVFERMVSPNSQLRFKSASEALAALPLGLIPKVPVYRTAFSS
ncbi:MAG: response regulator [Cyanobacteria bacterium P01_A01_bin.15]